MGGAGRAEKREIGPSSPIPDKLYFKIGEVAKLVGVQAHVLRYWQSEIPAVRPSKSASSQRRYRYKDVEIFREIRRLLYEERYTLAGARRRIIAREAPLVEPGYVELGSEGAGVLDVPGAPAVVAYEPQHPQRELGAGNAFTAPPRSAAPPPEAERPAALSETVPFAGRLPSVAHSRPEEGSADDEVLQRLRRGLRDLIRLAGEEP